MFSVANASSKDIELIKELSQKIWPQTYTSILSAEQIKYMLQMMYSTASLQQQFDNGHQFFILFDDGQPVGFASINQHAQDKFKLQKIYILPSLQGKGGGSFLLQHIFEVVSVQGATGLILNVNRENNAVQFYKKLGFEIISTEDIDIGEGYFMNDFVMEKKLNQLHNQP